MRISIFASGSRGDVQPYLALGKGLKAAGHSVRLLSSIDFEGLVRSAGLDFCSTGESVEAIVNSDSWRKTTESGNFLSIVLKMRQEIQSRAKSLAETLPDLIKEADLLIAGVGGFGGVFSAAEKFKIPFIQAYLFPIHPTLAFPSPLTPSLPFGKFLNAPSFQLLRFALWQTSGNVDAIVRQTLGMKKASMWEVFKALDSQNTPALYGYSRYVLPQPPDWNDNRQVTGYWFLDSENDWQAPQDLEDFLAAGAPPVYIGFGSMGSSKPQELAEIVLEALRLSGQRGVLATGWGGLTAQSLPDTVHMVSALPHSYLFPKMAAVVHHGGAGTTAAGLRAGVPSIVVPFMGDQAFWGQRVHDLGVGTKAIPRKQLSAEKLAEALQQAVTHQTMRQKAKELGTKISMENGVEKAVSLIVEQIKKGF